MSIAVVKFLSVSLLSIHFRRPVRPRKVPAVSAKDLESHGEKCQAPKGRWYSAIR